MSATFRMIVFSGIYIGNTKMGSLHAARVPRIIRHAETMPETPVTGVYGWESRMVSRGNEVGGNAARLLRHTGRHPGIGVFWVLVGYWIGSSESVWFHPAHAGMHVHRHLFVWCPSGFSCVPEGWFPRDRSPDGITISGIVWVSHEPMGCSR